jgi:hypothetical protein
MVKHTAIRRAIDSISADQWTPVRYPGAVRDPDTGAWLSDAEVAEVPYTAFASTTDRISARLVARRVKDARYPEAHCALGPGSMTFLRWCCFFETWSMPAYTRTRRLPLGNVSMLPDTRAARREPMQRYYSQLMPCVMPWTRVW